MASIHDLSNELLANIINFLDIDDLESFALTCRAFYNNSSSRLKVHFDLKREYNSIADGSFLPPDCIGTKRQKQLLSFLKKSIHRYPGTFLEIDIQLLGWLQDLRMDVIFKPQAELYTRTVCLGNTAHPEFRGPEASYDVDDLLNEVPFDFRLLIEHFWEMFEHDSESHGLQEIMYDVIDPSALVLISLPRLQRLKLQGEWFSVPDGREFWLSLSANVGSPAKYPPDYGAFRALNVIELSQVSGYHGMGCDTFRNLILNLPHLEKLKGYEIFAEVPGQMWTRSKPKSCSPIQSIEIRSSSIGASIWKEYLRGLKALRVFTYSHADRGSWNIPADYEWKPRCTVDYLKSYASHSLEKLELTIDWMRFKHRFFHGEPFIDSLKRFQVLKEVTLDPLLLFNHISDAAFEVICSDMFSRDESGKLKGEDENRYNSYDLMEMRKLQDIMPASIEQLTIAGHLSALEIDKMLEGLPAAKDRLLPKLRRIILLEGGNPNAATLAALIEVGVAFTVGRELRSQKTMKTKMLEFRNKEPKDWSSLSKKYFLDPLN